MEYMSKKLINMIMAAKQETCPLNGWILVTPEIAKMLKKFNTANYRVLEPKAVLKYASDMKAGLWQKNGESIIFSKEGQQKNGQHRLEGVIKSGVPTVMYLIFDADNCTIYDLQRKRTCVQSLRAAGYSVTNISTATARTMIAGSILRFSSVKVGDGEICDYVANHYETLKRVEGLVKCRIGKEKMIANRSSCAVIAYCMLRTGEIPESELVDFFTAMNSNRDCGANRDVSSALALRKQIDAFEGHGDTINDRCMQYTYLALKDFHNNVHVSKDFLYPNGSKDAERLIRTVQCMDGQCKFDPAA